MDAPLHLLAIDAELGDASEIGREAGLYLSGSRAPDYVDDYSILIRGYQFQARLITKGAFEEHRKAWLEDAKGLRGPSRPPGLEWSYAYARTVGDEEDARQALAQRPRYVPMLDASATYPFDDVATARVYRLAGKPDLALAHARRATRSCERLEQTLWVVQAWLEVGAAAEAMGDSSACDAYDVVLSRWGNARGSKSAAAARAGRARLRCAR